MSPANNAESAVLFHDISFSPETRTQRSPESCTAINKIEIARPLNRAQDGAKRMI
jgi:hypothetical protein